jgi:hypothetical protein
LFFHAEVDDSLTLDEFEVSPTDIFDIQVIGASAPPTPAAAPAPVLKELAVILLLGFIPRLANFRFDPNKTLADFAPEVIKKWDLGDLEIEFVAGLASEENWRVLPRSTLIADVPGKGDEESLAVREASSLTPDPVSANTSLLCSTLTTRYVSPTPLIPDDSVQSGTPYNFDLMDRGLRTYYFDATAKVLDAKQRIVGDYKVPSIERVTLLLSGKALKDTFLLSRLRVGDGVITVMSPMMNASHQSRTGTNCVPDRAIPGK